MKEEKLKNYYFALVDGIPGYWDSLGQRDCNAQLAHSNRTTPVSLASLKTIKRWIAKSISFRQNLGWDINGYEIRRAMLEARNK